MWSSFDLPFSVAATAAHTSQPMVWIRRIVRPVAGGVAICGRKDKLFTSAPTRAERRAESKEIRSSVDLVTWARSKDPPQQIASSQRPLPAPIDTTRHTANIPPERTVPLTPPPAAQSRPRRIRMNWRHDLASRLAICGGCRRFRPPPSTLSGDGLSPRPRCSYVIRVIRRASNGGTVKPLITLPAVTGDSHFYHQVIRCLSPSKTIMDQSSITQDPRTIPFPAPYPSTNPQLQQLFKNRLTELSYGRISP